MIRRASRASSTRILDRALYAGGRRGGRGGGCGPGSERERVIVSVGQQAELGRAVLEPDGRQVGLAEGHPGDRGGDGQDRHEDRPADAPGVADEDVGQVRPPFAGNATRGPWASRLASYDASEMPVEYR